jgi:LPXTG-site transpeptidase (sortase) family protein
MQSGHDAKEVKAKTRSRSSGVVGMVMVSIGAMLLLGVGVYYAFGFYSTTQLDDLNASMEGPLALPEDDSLFASSVPYEAPAPNATSLDDSKSSNEIILPDNSVLHGALMPDGSFKSAEVVKDISSFTPIESPNTKPDSSGAKLETAPSSNSDTNPAAQVTSPERAAFPVSAYASIYPGQQIHPKYWDAPLWAGTDTFTYGEVSRPGGFQRIAADAVPADLVTSSAKRISIPGIGVDALIEPLNVITEDDGTRRYESPVHVVGSIPETANPGERGNGWLFGHLESPLRGEGNVFHRLPEVPEYLNNGDPIYVSIETDEGEYLYQMVSSKVIPQEELELYDTDDATITLVTCSRRPFYDHRQIVTAKLVGFRELSQRG